MRHMAKMERLKAGNIECMRMGLNNAKLLLLLLLLLTVSWTGHYVPLLKSVDAAQIVSKSLNRHRFFCHSITFVTSVRHNQVQSQTSP